MNNRRWLSSWSCARPRPRRRPDSQLACDEWLTNSRCRPSTPHPGPFRHERTPMASDWPGCSCRPPVQARDSQIGLANVRHALHQHCWRRGQLPKTTIRYLFHRQGRPAAAAAQGRLGGDSLASRQRCLGAGAATEGKKTSSTAMPCGDDHHGPLTLPRSTSSDAARAQIYAAALAVPMDRFEINTRGDQREVRCCINERRARAWPPSRRSSSRPRPCSADPGIKPVSPVPDVLLFTVAIG